MFLKAQFSAQMATVVDFLATILLANLSTIGYVYATFLGAVTGGALNCIINYRWTFRTNGCKKRHVITKYILVWIGSIFLNTLGTYLLTEYCGRIEWVSEALGVYFANFFIISKIIVSLLVGVLWNYTMQRIFVYRNNNIMGLLTRKKNNY